MDDLRLSGSLEKDRSVFFSRLEGRAKVAFSDGEKLDGFFKEGVLHGFARCDDGEDDDDNDDDDDDDNDHVQFPGSLTERVDCVYWATIAMV